MLSRLALLIALVCAAPAVSVAACPVNHLRAGEISVDSALPVDERSFSDVSRDAHAHYNVPGAMLGIEFSGSNIGAPNGAGAIIEDDFSVVGVPSGTPVPLTAHLVATLNSVVTGPCCYSYVRAHLIDTNGHDVTVGYPEQPAPGPYDITLPVQAIAGQTFRLHFEVSGFGLWNPGSGSATFSFTGLPPGTAITSCQGYVSDPAVSSHGFTWGRVRSRYR